MTCCPNSTFQKLRRQAADATGAMARSIAHFGKTGEATASSAVMKTRMETCKGCDKFTGVRCRECGCVMLAKVVLAGSSCPLGKW